MRQRRRTPTDATLLPLPRLLEDSGRPASSSESMKATPSSATSSGKHEHVAPWHFLSQRHVWPTYPGWVPSPHWDQLTTPIRLEGDSSSTGGRNGSGQVLEGVR